MWFFSYRGRSESMKYRVSPNLLVLPSSFGNANQQQGPIRRDFTGASRRIRPTRVARNDKFCRVFLKFQKRKQFVSSVKRANNLVFNSFVLYTAQSWEAEAWNLFLRVWFPGSRWHFLSKLRQNRSTVQSTVFDTLDGPTTSVPVIRKVEDVIRDVI